MKPSAEGSTEPVRSRFGATPLDDGSTHFRVWAPRCERVEVVIEGAGGGERAPRVALLECDEQGFFQASVAQTPPGALYGYRLDGGPLRPDPVSRHQPNGVHGLSAVIDHASFGWTDAAWRGVAKRNLVIYELHVGAFTAEGTFASAIGRLAELVELGFTAIELMPVAQTPGRWNWGYDGVSLYAPRNTYGGPEGLKQLVDACHAAGLAVLLDVVYNHLGPEGNYLAEFGPYFTPDRSTPWGESFNYDGPQCEQVRRFVVENALEWLREYHLDGLRLDAVFFMTDTSAWTILDEIREATSRFAAAAGRTVHLIAESNLYDAELLKGKTLEETETSPPRRREPYDAIWCDCLMHAIHSQALPHLELTDKPYGGSGDLVASLRHGYVYSDRPPVRTAPGEHARRGRDWSDHDWRSSLVVALQTHDAVGNHPAGMRVHQLTSTAFKKAAAALTLLSPGIPLVFMGEECAAEAPFLFFADFEDSALRQAVDHGRREEYPQHDWSGSIAPSHPEAFRLANCGGTAPGGDSPHDPAVRQWYRQLIAFRKLGVAEGWLAADRMRVSHDSGLDLFTIVYEGPQGGAATILARLTPLDRESAPVKFEPPGVVVLDSHAGGPSCDGFLLQPHHAVVTRG
ncbi:Malto-oligosyltrehalose trehalohydrolase [Pseudobythopirellula maris]|uniref:Malto-oligosyltrehalose trehalohydrolase n=1 Tax=Pseudobythopirellula maris TaxID=2527991 RepID=A0A5C5ZV90_9BACT|nr:malto-oligosyltrehalose trehalohydrolase [Pseudobythopirellula maris]TWT90133.1 Malto-oligosyltrehalose trehalohydrolase [Pseudobythopirellula maris]